jgi:catechol 2,3-dioxygenase
MSTGNSIIFPTGIGAVSLRVKDLARSAAFYAELLGLESVDAHVFAAPGGGVPLVKLIESPDAAPRPPRTLGLYHFALLVPDRPSLARILRRLMTRGWRLQGASDHEVSEALYLADPDGHGIEIYRDRPKDEWRFENGQLIMSTLPLDMQGLLSESAAEGGLPQDTIMGHIHLHVSSLTAAEDFYSGKLGFDVTVRGYPGALFVSAGGYHHHIGLNTWAGPGAAPPSPDRIGMEEFEIISSDVAAGDHHVQDPNGNRILLRPLSESVSLR